MKIQKQEPSFGEALGEFLKLKTVQLLLCVSGILGSLLGYGLIQERIMTTAYGHDDEGNSILFTHSAFLVFCNRIVAIIGATVILSCQGEALKNKAPVMNYFAISFSNVAATFCQYEALRWISFPTQTLGKCGKMIPVMVLGYLISGKKYTFKDALIAAGVTSGCMVFVLTGDLAASHADKGDSIWGLLLMVGYMFSDGFTSTFQEKLFKDYTVSTYSQMLWVNLCSATISFLYLIGTGTLFPAISFAMEYNRLGFDAVLLSLCAFVGQTAIYFTIKTFGALVFAIIMTTRQFSSILLSCLVYLHPLSLPQWGGAAVVFVTLYYKAFGKKARKAPEPESNMEEGLRR